MNNKAIITGFGYRMRWRMQTHIILHTISHLQLVKYQPVIPEKTY